MRHHTAIWRARVQIFPQPPLRGIAGNLLCPAASGFPDCFGCEHSLEVHLPFLQTVLEDFSLVPLVVGEASAETIGRVLETLWGGDETLIVISSDLSHYHDYRTAQQMDNATSQAIIELRFEDIDLHDACGRIPIGGLLWLARQRGLQGEIVDLRNSGDTAGPRDQVVGYGAYAFRE
jgi:AmmeMemoRadiSam system protein B